MKNQSDGNGRRTRGRGVTAAVLAVMLAAQSPTARADGLLGETINVGITSWEPSGPNVLFNDDVLVEAGVTELNLLFWDDVVRVDLEDDFIEIQLTDIGSSFFLFIEGERPLVFDFASVDPTGGELEIFGIEVTDNNVLLDHELITGEVISPTAVRISIGDQRAGLEGALPVTATIRANLQLSHMPEPATVSLLAVGGLVMATRRPRRKAG